MGVVEVITDRYPLIKEAKEKYDNDLEKMADLFSLDIDELRKMGVRIGESTESILKRFHEYNGSIQAKKETQVKSLYDSLSELTPGHQNYTRDFNRKVKSLTTLVPQLVRANLTGYIARRKLVLMIFRLAIQKELECQKKDAATTPKKKEESKEYSSRKVFT